MPETSFLFAALLGGAVFAGCPVFAPGSAYNAPVTRAAVDSHSNEYITSAILAGNTGGFWIASPAVEYVNVARVQTPRRAVRQKAAYHRFERDYPWEPSFRIEPLNDAHAIVVDPQTCRLFETYDTTYESGTLWAYSGAVWNLRAPFQPLPPGNPSSMASGLSLFAGAVRWEEIERGTIDHALNWAPPAGSVAQWSFVSPASDTDGIAFRGESPYRLPYGAHLRLKASFDASHFGPQAKAIVRAMKTYGIYLADTGSSGNALYNTAPPDGSNPWDKRDLAALDAIRLRDFDVLQLPPLQRVPGH
ncbi:MAG TPA: hypothetical protein VFL13_01075 [Candidatus Baltobacteraceae bacterium]|nr:hypothetical protein [Candidatus Baltobacteraceae bacterium]